MWLVLNERSNWMAILQWRWGRDGSPSVWPMKSFWVLKWGTLYLGTGIYTANRPTHSDIHLVAYRWWFSHIILLIHQLRGPIEQGMAKFMAWDVGHYQNYFQWNHPHYTAASHKSIILELRMRGPLLWNRLSLQLHNTLLTQPIVDYNQSEPWLSLVIAIWEKYLV